MTPHTAPPDSTTPTVVSSSLEVQIAVLTEKVTQVIGDHERRIQALEQRASTNGSRAAAIAAPYIAGSGVIIATIIAVSGRVSWQ